MKQSRFYTPDLMLSLVTQIRQRGDIVKIIEKYSFSKNGFRKALKNYKEFYIIENKNNQFWKTQKLKKLKAKLEFLKLAHESWRKGDTLKDFAKKYNLKNDTAMRRLARSGIFWKRNADANLTDITFKKIIQEHENEIRDLERLLSTK
ncbi:MAG: hypothetical protein IM592_11305 [Bacteroidetes bacterium]|nr:hypothetical protein [Bacteroidota bacterium]